MTTRDKSSASSSQPEGLTLPLRADLETLQEQIAAYRRAWDSYRQQWPRSFNGEVAEPLAVERENTLIGAFIRDLDQLAAYLVSCVNQMHETKGDPTRVDTLSSAIPPPGSTAVSNEAVRQCEACGGSGQVVIGEQHVSHDMAIDAGDRSLEGFSLGPEFGACDECGGGGLVSEPAVLPVLGHREGQEEKEMHEEATRMDSKSHSPQHIDAGQNETDSATVSDDQKRNEP